MRTNMLRRLQMPPQVLRKLRMTSRRGYKLTSNRNTSIFKLMYTIVPTLFDYDFNDIGTPDKTVTEKQAAHLFNFFKQHPLFIWGNANNGCEGRADAVCILLDELGIPNYKGWVFSGAYLKNHVGELKNNWKYHVA